MTVLNMFVGYVLELGTGQKYVRLGEGKWYRFVGPSLALQGRDAPALERVFKDKQAENFELDADA